MKRAGWVLAGLLLFCYLPLRAAGSAPCEYTPRAQVGELLRSLPVDIVGLANCGDRFPETSVFLISEIHPVNVPVIAEYSVALARLLDHGSQKSELVWRSKTKSQMLIRTSTAGQSSTMTHYAFSVRAPDGRQYLFTHSLDTRETQKLRPTLDQIHSELTKPAFLKALGPQPGLEAMASPRRALGLSGKFSPKR